MESIVTFTTGQVIVTCAASDIIYIRRAGQLIILTCANKLHAMVECALGAIVVPPPFGGGISLLNQFRSGRTVA